VTARPARFLEVDLKRAVSAVAKSGVRDARVEISLDGTITVVMGAAAKLSNRRNTCDDLLD
jgi:hypothetical protein